MKPTRDEFTVQGNLHGERTKMTIDEGAMEHIMGLLTDVYTDPEMAVIREYATNATDAHVEAGNPLPIEVTLPSPLSPFLVIQDYGIGLSADDIREIYSKYGASTKRDTNEATGMLGIGCKAGLAYGAQFTLSSVKDGEYIAVSVTRDEDGGGSMIVPDQHHATDEQSGTRISIPVKRENQFAMKAEHFFSFWPEGSVLVNGQPPKRFPGEKVTDTLYVLDENYRPAWIDRYSDHRDSYVVMGNVPYPTRSLDNAGVRLVAYVPIGTVNFPPARESLRDNKRTRETLAGIAESWARHQRTVYQAEIDAAPTRAEAVAAAYKWGKLLRLKFTQGQPIGQWRGTDIPEYVLSTTAEYQLRTSENRTWDLGRSANWRHVTPIHASQGLIVYDFAIQLQAQHKRKMRKYLENHPTLENTKDSVETFYLWPGPKPTSPWIAPERMVSYETIREIKLPMTQNIAYGDRGKTITGSFYIRRGEAQSWSAVEMAAQDIAAKVPEGHVYWCDGGKYYGRSEIKELVAILDADALVVMVPANREAKFKRDFPTVPHWRDALVAAEQKIVAGCTEDERYVAWVSYYQNQWYQRLISLDPARIDDPALKAEVERLKRVKIRPPVARLSKLRYTEVPGWDAVKWESPDKKYPLLGTWHKAHVYLYVNAVYAATKEGE